MFLVREMVYLLELQSRVALGTKAALLHLLNAVLFVF